jgi:hypothetical protein
MYLAERSGAINADGLRRGNYGMDLLRAAFGLFVLGAIVAVPVGLYNWMTRSIGTVPTIILIGVVIVAAFAIPAVRKANRASEARRAAEEQTRRQRQAAETETKRQRAAAQESLLQQLGWLSSSATTAFGQIPKLLLDAEAMLDRAEQEFNEGLFSPFWEAVEQALRNLASASAKVDEVANSARQHSHTLLAYEGQPVSFPVDARCSAALELARETERRLRAIVRNAQKNFQFATIYEQRRTTNVLIDGFQTLAGAIDGMAYRLQNSLESLGSAIRDLEAGQATRHSETLGSMFDIREALNNNAEQARLQHAETAKQRELTTSKQTQVAFDQLAMLDNIQRTRKPLDDERGPRPRAIWDA